MNTTSWLGLGFVALLALAGLAAVIALLRSISRSDLDDSAKSRWGLLIGLSPGAGMYAWFKRKELLGHGSDEVGDKEDGTEDGTEDGEAGTEEK